MCYISSLSCLFSFLYHPYYASFLKFVGFFIYFSSLIFIYTQCKLLSGGQAPIKIPILYVLIVMECLRLELIMEMLRYTCVQISPLWFAILISEKVVIRKTVRSHFLFIVVMETLKYTCIPSFTSMHCMISKFEK